MSLKSCSLTLGLAVLLLASPSRAADLDRYLPADTEVYSVVNVRQILNSALVKRLGVENLRAMINQNEEATKVLKDLGLDPLKDIDKIVSAGPASGENDKGLIIVHGRFDVEKFRARANKEVKDNKDVVKAVKIAGQECYEVVVSDGNVQGVPPSFFVGFASKNIILVAPSKDYLGDALKVKADETVTLKSKAFQDMLSKLDDKQSMALVLPGDVLTKGEVGKNLPGAVKDSLAKIKTISGGLTLTDGVKIELTSGMATPRDALDLKNQITDGINLAIGLAALAQNKEIAPVIDFLKSIKTTSRDKTVTIKAEVTGEDLNKVLPKDQ